MSVVLGVVARRENARSILCAFWGAMLIAIRVSGLHCYTPGRGVTSTPSIPPDWAAHGARAGQ